MKLVSLFTIFEAGETNRQAEVPGKKRRGFGKKTSSVQNPELGKGFWTGDPKDNDLPKKMSLADFPDDDDDEFGDDLGDDDFQDPIDEPDEPRHSASVTPEKEPEKPIPFASKSAPPSKAMQGGKSAGSVKADPATLKALIRALNAVRTNDDDLQDWIDDVIREIERANKSGSDLSLPKFEATPDLADFDDDSGSDEDEEF